LCSALNLLHFLLATHLTEDHVLTTAQTQTFTEAAGWWAGWLTMMNKQIEQGQLAL
jgi:hypothetical protein